MHDTQKFDVVVVGGSFAGLSAAMALGRSLRKVLLIDSGRPCNIQTPHSHNFLTEDGETPEAIRNKAISQTLSYPTASFRDSVVNKVSRDSNTFVVETTEGESFTAKKVLFATGIRDIMPDIEGFAACWGISILHCPYCHGYEVRHKKIGVLGNGDMGYEFVKLISNWSQDLVLFTNGTSTLNEDQVLKLQSKGVEIVEEEIQQVEHEAGTIQNLLLKGGTSYFISALFARVPFEQHSSIPNELGCELTDHGFIKVDDFQRTTLPGIYAAGDNSYGMRSVAAAVAAGNKAGAVINKDLIDEEF
ncbi:NAD(P)/FAD-dependent oxidoreductase [Telluribacter sp. SYSU D00476]|uniref:NAD(P)/FAD-dependent oxidoreductase n=1 Tax=Telluribacter sp. SYSU D00476 TaxID=2811430 RepID=UPI001FF0F836|nr:NAD(P)/FAD-dependent oxidoreductase [Telluribacter sp. SYSU D00476]